MYIVLYKILDYQHLFIEKAHENVPHRVIEKMLKEHLWIKVEKDVINHTEDKDINDWNGRQRTTRFN